MIKTRTTAEAGGKTFRISIHRKQRAKCKFYGSIPQTKATRNLFVPTNTGGGRIVPRLPEKIIDNQKSLKAIRYHFITLFGL